MHIKLGFVSFTGKKNIFFWCLCFKIPSMSLAAHRDLKIVVQMEWVILVRIYHIDQSITESEKPPQGSYSYS